MKTPSSPSIPSARKLLDWYDRNRRTLPWRAVAGDFADPYHVWISEIMLQQTTVTAVIPYYRRFLERFPRVEDLARAPLDDVLALWSGLGYYARARNLHKCAVAVAALGGFPQDIEGLRQLPGIGVYTAAAIGAIAFGLPVVPVDGNVERVVARLFAVSAPLPGSRRMLAELAVPLNMEREARKRSSDFAQALFDLGATICTPRSPACVLCPWQDFCEARKQGLQSSLPAKAPKQAKPSRHGIHFALFDETGRLFVRRRPDVGLLGGTIELPGTPWRESDWSLAEALDAVPFENTLARDAKWIELGKIHHIFTHFALSVRVFSATLPVLPNPMEGEGMVVALRDSQGLGFSSLMRKCLTLAVDEEQRRPRAAKGRKGEPNGLNGKR